MRKQKFMPRPATIISIVALVAAFGGTAYAASKIDTNDIKNNAVTSKKIENETIRGVDVKPQSLKGKHIAEGKIGLRKLNPNAVESLKPRWLLVNEKGEIEEQSGGFTVVDAYTTDDNVYIDAGSSLEGKGLTATIALQNQLDLDGEPGADPSFNGQISIARCQTEAVDCAPETAKNDRVFVVAPRQDDGSATDADTRERFYVQITP